jgi:colanic acid biosynthesis glycosyl transferase WcaI
MGKQSTRVLILGLNFTPEHSGNAPYTGALARGLARAGLAVEVIAAHPHYPEWKFRHGYGQWSRNDIEDGVRVRRLRHYVPRPPRGVRRLLSEVSFGTRAIFARWGQPDVVLLVSPAMISSAMVAFRARLFHRSIPVVVWVQDIYTLGLAETGQGGGLTARVMRTLEGGLLRGADKVIVIHDRFAQKVNEEFEVPLEQMLVVRNWTHVNETPEFSREQLRRELGWGDDEVIVLHTGNMGVKQGLENVVNAARIAADQGVRMRFVLMGDGGERARLQELGAGIPALTFIPPVAGEKYPQVLASADWLLVNELEGVSEMAVPSKLTSYFSSGRPVLAATDIFGITAGEVETAGAGVVVAAGDPQALVDAAVEILAEPDLAIQRGKNGIEYRMNVLSEDVAVASFIEIFTSSRS